MNLCVCSLLVSSMSATNRRLRAKKESDSWLVHWVWISSGLLGREANRQKQGRRLAGQTCVWLADFEIKSALKIHTSRGANRKAMGKRNSIFAVECVTIRKQLTAFLQLYRRNQVELVRLFYGKTECLAYFGTKEASRRVHDATSFPTNSNASPTLETNETNKRKPLGMTKDFLFKTAMPKKTNSRLRRNQNTAKFGKGHTQSNLYMNLYDRKKSKSYVRTLRNGCFTHTQMRKTCELVNIGSSVDTSGKNRKLV